MSKGNSPIKVLRTALKRVQKGWTKHMWSFRGEGGITYVCLEGAVYGYCDSAKHTVTAEQRKAINVLREIIKERTGIMDIPSFNDAPATTQQDVEEIIKLGIIRLETDAIMGDDDFDDLIDFIETKEKGARHEDEES